MTGLRDGPAGSLSPDTRTVTATAADLFLSKGIQRILRHGVTHVVRSPMLSGTPNAATRTGNGDYPVITLAKAATTNQKICTDISISYAELAIKVWYFRYRRI